MGSRVVKGENHDHILKTVNEEYMGLLMDDRGTDKISETFGWRFKKFEDCFEKMEHFSKFQDAADRLYNAGEEGALLPKSTKTSTFIDFLKSNVFKELNIKLETPNDYFMMGFIFCATVIKIGIEETLDEISGNKADPKKVLALLKEFRRAIGERR